MAPLARSFEMGARRCEEQADMAQASSGFVFSFSLLVASTMGTTLAPASVRERERAQEPERWRPRPPSRKPRVSRASTKAKTIAPSVSASTTIQPPPEVPTAAACDVTQERLSAEAQAIQDQARASYNARISKESDRESLRCLESFPLHISLPTHSDRASLAIPEHATSRQSYTSPYTSPPVPKYYPPSPTRCPPPRAAFDEPATPTNKTSNSSGRPLESIEDDREDSCSVDSELFRDDIFHDHQEGVALGHRFYGVSVFQRLEEIAQRQAGRSGAVSSRSQTSHSSYSHTSSPRSSGSPQVLQRDQIQEWMHVDGSLEVSEGMEEEVQDSMNANLADHSLMYQEYPQHLNEQPYALGGLQRSDGGSISRKRLSGPQMRVPVSIPRLFDNTKSYSSEMPDREYCAESVSNVAAEDQEDSMHESESEDGDEMSEESVQNFFKVAKDVQAIVEEDSVEHLCASDPHGINEEDIGEDFEYLCSSETLADEDTAAEHGSSTEKHGASGDDTKDFGGVFGDLRIVERTQASAALDVGKAEHDIGEASIEDLIVAEDELEEAAGYDFMGSERATGEEVIFDDHFSQEEEGAVEDEEDRVEADDWLQVEESGVLQDEMTATSSDAARSALLKPRIRF